MCCVEPLLVKNKLVYIFGVLLTLDMCLVNLASGSQINGQEQSSHKTQYYPLADHLLAKIKNDHWREDEKQCFNDISRLFEAARNHTLWATWVLDSMQLPVGALYGSRYHLGNFDQCLDERWSSSHPELQTQYCLVDVTTQEQSAREFDPYEDAEVFVKSKSIHGRRHSLHSFGVCVPASCRPQSVEKISIYIIGASHLPYGNVSVDPQNCQGKTNKQIAYSFGFYVFWFIIIISVAAATTVYVVEDYITNPKLHLIDIENGYGNGSPDGFLWLLSEIAAWFSPSKNFRSLVDIRANDVKSLHGIRCLSSGTVVLLHYIYVANTLTIINHASVGKDADTYIGRPLSHLEILINSFNVLTGFLFVRRHYDTETLKLFEVLYKRYQRFIALYAMVILFVVSVSPHMGSGPLWPRYLKLEHEPCVKDWWSGLIMMFDTDNLCYMPTWYISCDFQLSILGLAILWCWKKDQKKGLMVFSIALSASIVLPAFLTYRHRLSPFLLHDIDIALDFTQNQVYQKVYSKTYCNASSYLIGFATGYLLTAYKPEQNKMMLSKVTSIISSLALSYIVITMMNAIGSLLFKEYDSFVYAWYASIDGLVWAVALCGLILICEYGTLPVVVDLLGNKLLVVGSRLSYGVYLIHMLLVNRNLYSLRAPITYDIVHWIVNGMGYVVVSFFLSYLQWFIIEAPATNMFKYFEKNRSRNQSNNQDGKRVLTFEKPNKNS